MKLLTTGFLQVFFVAINTYFTKGRRELNGKRVSNIIKCTKTGNEHHPTEKPVNLMQFLIEKSSNRGDLVLDNFFGSGATAIACHDYGFDLTACELDDDYYKSAIKRVHNHVSQKRLF